MWCERALTSRERVKEGAGLAVPALPCSSFLLLQHLANSGTRGTPLPSSLPLLKCPYGGWGHSFSSSQHPRCGESYLGLSRRVLLSASFVFRYLQRPQRGTVSFHLLQCLSLLRLQTLYPSSRSSLSHVLVRSRHTVLASPLDLPPSRSLGISARLRHPASHPRLGL